MSILTSSLSYLELWLIIIDKCLFFRAFSARLKKLPWTFLDRYFKNYQN